VLSGFSVYGSVYGAASEDCHTHTDDSVPVRGPTGIYYVCVCVCVCDVCVCACVCVCVCVCLLVCDVCVMYV